MSNTRYNGRVRDDVLSVLQLHQPVTVRQSFDRPNIHYSVRYTVCHVIDSRSLQDIVGNRCTDVISIIKKLSNSDTKAQSAPAPSQYASFVTAKDVSNDKSLINKKRAAPPPPSSSSLCGIVYCRSKKSCDDVAAKLTSSGIRCEVYHADNKERDSVAYRWASGALDVVCVSIVQ